MAKKKKRAAKRTPKIDRPTGRFTAAAKEEILKQIDMGRTRVEVAGQYGVHAITIARWLKLREGAKNPGDSSGPSGLVPKSTKPIHSPSPVTPEQRELILEVKSEHPEMGPAQIRNQLRRFHGISLSHKTIGKVLRDAGHKLEKRVSDREEAVIERFEMSRPNELWTFDTKNFYVHDLKVYLVSAIDDFSRYLVSHELFRQPPGADQAISVLKRGISRHGKPDRVLTDRGGEFHSWSGVAAFTRHLEEEGIAHSLARPHHPQTTGKIEAWHATLEKELIGKIRFDSFGHARKALASWVEEYNLWRTHMGIGGVTPADRYFGRVDRGLLDLEKNLPSIDRPGEDRKYPGERAVLLQLCLVEGKVELWVAGKRIELG